MRNLTPSLVALFLTLLPLCADTVVLKSGEKYEGRILRESVDSVVMEVKVSASITDEKLIPRDEVQSMEVSKPDSEAFEKLKNVRPDPQTSRTLDEYERILGALQEFQMTYPDSKHGVVAGEVITVFQAEKTRVEAGEIKIFGNWLTKEQVEKNRNDIESQALLAQMQSAMSRGDYAGAMNTFQALETRYEGSKSYPAAVDSAKQVLAVVVQNIARALESQKQELANREKVLASSAEPQRTALVNQFRGMDARYDSVFATAEKGALKWKPFIPQSAKSVDAWRTTVGAEITRLQKIDTAKLRDAAASVTRAMGMIENGDFDGADQLLKDAKVAWPKFEGVTKAADQIKAAKAAAAAASPTPKAVDASTVSANQVAQKKAVAEAEAVAEGEKKPFFKTIPGALSILVGLGVVFAALNAVSKAKGKKGGAQ